MSSYVCFLQQLCDRKCFIFELFFVILLFAKEQIEWKTVSFNPCNKSLLFVCLNRNKYYQQLCDENIWNCDNSYLNFFSNCFLLLFQMVFFITDGPPSVGACKLLDFELEMVRTMTRWFYNSLINRFNFSVPLPLSIVLFLTRDVTMEWQWVFLPMYVCKLVFARGQKFISWYAWPKVSLVP